MAQLVIIRHGDCIWHSKKAFNGWMNVPLSANGIIDAIKAGGRIAGIDFDLVVTSLQIRSIETAMVALTQNTHKKIPLLVNEEESLENWIVTNQQAMQKGLLPVFRSAAFTIHCEQLVPKTWSPGSWSGSRHSRGATVTINHLIMNCA